MAKADCQRSIAAVVVERRQQAALNWNGACAWDEHCNMVPSLSCVSEGTNATEERADTGSNKRLTAIPEQTSLCSGGDMRLTLKVWNRACGPRMRL